MDQEAGGGNGMAVKADGTICFLGQYLISNQSDGV